MHFGLLDWAAFLGTPLLATFIARIWTRGSRRQDISGNSYFYASGALGSFAVANTYLGANLTFTSIFLILSEEAYLRGYWVFSVPICWLVGTWFFITLYPKIKPYIEDRETLHEAMGSCYGSQGMRLAASLWTIVAFVGTVGLEFYGAFVLLQWAGIPPGANLAIAMTLAFVASYFTVTGGLRGVAIADYILNGATFVGLLLLLAYWWRSPASHASTLLTTSNGRDLTIIDNVLFVISMIIIFVPFQLCTLDSWQRLVAWKQKAESPGSWLATSGFGLALIYCIPIFIGISVRNSGIGNITYPFHSFLNRLSVPTGITGLILGGFAAAILSTADELLNCCGLSMVFDTLQLSKEERFRSAKSSIAGKFYTALFAFASAGIALLSIRFERRISDLALAFFSTQVVFTVPLLIMFKNKERARKLQRFVIVGMAVAFGSAVGLVLLGWKLKSQDTVDAAPVGAFILSTTIIVAGLVVTSLRRKSANAA